jgi:peptidoglycan/xylan/chitin deacetylase (PgdA/CDA1 family)
MTAVESNRRRLRLACDRAVKCGLSLPVFLYLQARALLLRALRRGSAGRCVVLYYHSVPPGERPRFALQLDWLLRWAQPLRTGDAGKPAPGSHSVAITFDDGCENFLSEALPELARRKIPATVFVIAGGMRKEFGPEESAERLLSVEQLLALPTELVSIGSHTMTHPLLTALGEDEARREITESRARLESLLGRPIQEFSFPFGGFNEALVELCREAGYRRVYTTLPGFAFEHGDEFVVGRVRVDPSDSYLEFRLKVAGAYGWLPAAIRWKRRLRAALRRLMAMPEARPSAPRTILR